MFNQFYLTTITTQSVNMQTLFEPLIVFNVVLNKDIKELGCMYTFGKLSQ